MGKVRNCCDQEDTKTRSDVGLYGKFCRDGWYAWVVAGIAFTCHFITVGLAYTVGVFFVVFVEVFGHSRGTTAWITSLNFGVLCAVGPLVSALINKFGCRCTMVLGGLVSGAGLMISAFANDIWVLMASFGVITGAGYGLVFSTGIVVIGQHFRYYRSVAMGISISGCGFGTFAYPMLTKFLIDLYGWRSALLICSGFTLQVCVLGMLIRPPPKDEYFDGIDAKNFKDYQKEETGRKHWCLDLCRNSMYWVICLNTLLYCFGQSVLYTHISAYASSVGIEAHRSVTLISSIGIANLAGRVALGCMAQHNAVDTQLLFGVSYVISGIAIILCTWLPTFPGMMAAVTTYGFFSAAFGPLLTEVTYELVGVTRFPTAYGWIMIFMAIGTLFGAPCAGALYDSTLFYEASFYLGGASILASAFLILTLRLVTKMCSSNSMLGEQMIGDYYIGVDLNPQIIESQVSSV